MFEIFLLSVFIKRPFHGVKHLSTLGLNYAQARLMQPILVRETNRPKLFEKITQAPMNAFKKSTGTSFLSDVVVSPKVNESIVDIALGAQQTIQNNGHLRNVLLYPQYIEKFIPYDSNFFLEIISIGTGI